jgi:hypothetical protein
MRLNPFKHFSVAFAGGQFLQHGISIKAKKAHQMLIGWGIVIVFPILFGECRPAFVEHSGQDHESAQANTKTSRRALGQINEGRLSFHFLM